MCRYADTADKLICSLLGVQWASWRKNRLWSFDVVEFGSVEIANWFARVRS